MTSLQTTMKSVSRPRASSGFTSAYWEASPSPVSPTTRKETSSRPACWSRIKSSGRPTVSRCILIQRRRSTLVGSPRKGLRYWFRVCQRGMGLIHEKDGPPEGATLASLQRHPAPASESREEPTVSFPDVTAARLSSVDTSDLPSFKEPSRELVGEFAVGIMFLYEVEEPGEGVLV